MAAKNQTSFGETLGEAHMHMLRSRKRDVALGARKFKVPAYEHRAEEDQDEYDVQSDREGSLMSVSDSDSENISRSLMQSTTHVKSWIESNEPFMPKKKCTVKNVTEELFKVNLNNGSGEVADGATAEDCTTLAAGTDDVPDDDDRSGTTEDSVPVTVEESWKLNMTGINHALKSNFQWADGNGCETFLGECFHVLRNTACSCEENKSFTTCKICKKVFCSIKCFKKEMKLNSVGWSTFGDDGEPKAESRPTPVKFKDVGTTTEDLEVRSIAEDENKPKQTSDESEKAKNNQICLLPSTQSSPTGGITIPPKNLWPVQILRKAARGVRISKS